MKISNRLSASTVATDKRPAGEAPARPAADGDRPEFVAGQIVRGKVVAVEGEGRVLLEVGDQTVSARTLVPLAKGVEVLLEVREGGDLPWLALAGKKGLVQEAVRLLLGEAPGLARAAGLLSGGSDGRLAGAAAETFAPAVPPAAVAGPAEQAGGAAANAVGQTLAEVGAAVLAGPEAAPRGEAASAASQSASVDIGSGGGVAPPPAAGPAPPPDVAPAPLPHAAAAVPADSGAGAAGQPGWVGAGGPEVSPSTASPGAAPGTPAPPSLASPAPAGGDPPGAAAAPSGPASGAIPSVAVASGPGGGTVVAAGNGEAVAAAGPDLPPAEHEAGGAAAGQARAAAPEPGLVKPSFVSRPAYAGVPLRSVPQPPAGANGGMAPASPPSGGLPVAAAVGELPALPPELAAMLDDLRQVVSGGTVDGRAEVGKLAQMVQWVRADHSPLAGGKVGAASLRTQLPELVEALAGRGEKDLSVAGGGAVAADLDKMVRLLDGLQQLNGHPPSPNQPVFLLLPCFFAGGAGWGQWLFSLEGGEGGRGGEEEGGSSIDFFLQMSRLGDLHLKVHLKGSGINGEFFAAAEQVRAHLTARLPQLAAILEEHGFRPVALSCKPARENLLHAVKKILEEKAQLRAFAILDVKA